MEKYGYLIVLGVFFMLLGGGTLLIAWFREKKDK